MKKIIALATAAMLVAPLQAATLPLSQSSTFTGLQNRVSALETGTAKLSGNQVFQNNVCAAGNSSFCLSTGAGPYLNFAPNSLIQWNPSSSQFEIFVGSTAAPKVSITGSALNTTVPVAARTSLGVAPASGTGRNTYLGFTGTENFPIVAFDGAASRIQLGAGGTYLFYIGGTAVASIDGNGNLRIKGQLSQLQGSIGN